jgi:hypothetical protein
LKPRINTPLQCLREKAQLESVNNPVRQSASLVRRPEDEKPSDNRRAFGYEEEKQKPREKKKKKKCSREEVAP